MADLYYEWLLSNNEDCTEAGGIAPDMEIARREALHYLAQYGPGHRVELRRVEVIMEAKHD